jgi:hypothetical protein
MDADHAFAGQSLRTHDDRLVIYMILVSVSIACVTHALHGKSNCGFLCPFIQ